MKKNRSLGSDLDAECRFGSAGAIRLLEEKNSGDRRRLLLVHGYLNSERTEADYSPLVTAARQAGWTGAIYGLVWDGGDTLTKIQAIARRIVFLGIPVPGPHSVLIPARLGYFAYAIRRYWSDACNRADAAGQALGRHLVREAGFNPNTRWTIAAHSLGCRLTFEVLTAINGTNGIIEDVLLCGGAVSAKVDWSHAAACVGGNMINCYSKRDNVLRFFFQLAEWQAPIGLGPIPSRCDSVSNHDCSEKVSNHFSYHEAFVEIFESVIINHAPCQADV